MYPHKIAQTLYDNVTPVAVTSSTDATPIVVTATAHGYTNGQRVLIFGHATNVAANGIYVAASVTTNSFVLTDEITGANIAGSGAGAGSGGLTVPAPPVIYMTDFRNVILQVGTSGTSTTTLKVAGSLGKSALSSKNPRGSYPNFAGTITPTNPYSYLQVINLDTAAAVNGATGIVVAGTDINNQYEVNVNGMVFLTVFPATWTQGAITIKALCITNV